MFPELFELWASGQNTDPNSWQDPSHRGPHNRNVHIGAPARRLPVRSLKLFHCMVPKLFTLALLLVNNACFLVFFFFLAAVEPTSVQICDDPMHKTKPSPWTTGFSGDGRFGVNLTRCFLFGQMTKRRAWKSGSWPVYIALLLQTVAAVTYLICMVCISGNNGNWLLW